MTDLERRALLGDAEAQRECTEKWIVLPCPFCGGPATAKPQKVQYGLSGTIISCKKCMAQLYSPDERAVPTPDGLRNMPIENHVKIGIGRWNTRPAPPIGRFGECAYGIPYKEEHIICKGRWTDKTYNDFCSDFVPKGGEEDGTAAD